MYWGQHPPRVNNIAPNSFLSETHRNAQRESRQSMFRGTVARAVVAPKGRIGANVKNDAAARRYHFLYGPAANPKRRPEVQLDDLIPQLIELALRAPFRICRRAV